MSEEFEKLKKELLSDNKFKEEYDALEAQYIIIKELIKLRIKENLTQDELAKRIGIPKSNISRFENGKHTPTLETLTKFAAGLNKKIVITLVDI